MFCFAPHSPAHQLLTQFSLPDPEEVLNMVGIAHHGPLLYSVSSSTLLLLSYCALILWPRGRPLAHRALSSFWSLQSLGFILCVDVRSLTMAAVPNDHKLCLLNSTVLA